MSNAILLVYTNCPAEREAEFNRWYDEVHIPDLLREVPGIEAARRYKLSGPAPAMQLRDGSSAVAQYLAVYEITTDDTRGFMRRITEVSQDLGRRGRMFDGLQLVAAVTYTALGERQTAPA